MSNHMYVNFTFDCKLYTRLQTFTKNNLIGGYAHGKKKQG